MAIPAAAALHESGFAVDWVAGYAVAPLLALYPWIHVIAVDESSLLRGSLQQRTLGMLNLWRTLRAHQQLFAGPYDLVATLYYDRRYQLLSLPLRARRRVALSRSDRRTELLPGRHHTDEYARILCNRHDQQTPWQLAPVPVPHLPPPPLVSDGERPRVILVPAGARNTLRDDRLRRWPVENYVALATGLLEFGCEVVLVGGPEDRWASPPFTALGQQAGPGQLIDRLGAFSLVETLALLHSAAVTVTHDTGPLHMAGITASAVVALFGPTDPHGRLPRRSNTVALWGGEGFACRPCYDGRDYAPCPHNGCMDQITPVMALAEIRTLLLARRESRLLPPRVLAPISAGLVQIARVAS